MTGRPVFGFTRAEAGIVRDGLGLAGCSLARLRADGPEDRLTAEDEQRRTACLLAGDPQRAAPVLVVLAEAVAALSAAVSPADPAGLLHTLLAELDPPAD